MPLAADREANDNPAYLLGRIWSLLRDMEVATYGEYESNAIWLDKMGNASTNPVIALSIYASHAPSWLRRLHGRDERQAQIADRIDARVATLAARIEPGVRPVGTDASLWFNLGYWHQQAADRRDNELVDV